MKPGPEPGAHRPTVLVTLGTDHHKFERLMDWFEAWIADHPDAARVVVQHGFSRQPQGADGFQLCPHDELLERTRASDVVVTQGGPGGIMDSRDCGIKPIVVPRLAALGEAVDDHQVSFAEHMAREGLIILARTEAEFRTELATALADPTALRVDAESASVEAAVTRVGDLIEDLVRRRPARYRRRHPSG